METAARVSAQRQPRSSGQARGGRRCLRASVYVCVGGGSLLPLEAAVRTHPPRATGPMWENLLASTLSPRFSHILMKPHPLHRGLRKPSWGRGAEVGHPVIALHPAPPCPPHCRQRAPSAPPPSAQHLLWLPCALRSSMTSTGLSADTLATSLLAHL